MKAIVRFPELRRALRALVVEQDGQGMVEYATTSTILAIGAVGAVGGWPFASMMINGLDSYLKGIYFVLHTPFP